MDPAKSDTLSIKVTHRDDRSIPTFILHHLLKPFNTSLIRPKQIYPAGSPRLEINKTAARYCDVKERMVEDIYIYDLCLRPSLAQNGSGSATKKRRRLYYFAGGGWQMPPSAQHWTLCTELARQLPHITISIVSYPLAPNSPASVSFSQMIKLYRQLLRDAEDAQEQVILAGDSAGGNVILCLTLAALAEDENTPCPRALLAISPSCDLRRQNPDIQVLEKHDPILRIPFINKSARQWCGDWNEADPRVTPIMADLSPLARRGVKVHGIVGRYDILSPDAVLFRMKCEEAGVHGEWLDWEKQMHCFPLAWYYLLPESKEAKDWMIDLLRRN